MKHFRYAAAFFSIILFLAFFSARADESESYCLTGAFLSDKPSKKDITDFEDNYGKKPFLVMIFVDWENFIKEKVVTDVYFSGCVLFVTWEPWRAADKKGIDYDGLLSGKWDKYIMEFADKLKDINKTVFLRFGHEMNGNWYPWSASRIGAPKYIALYRYIKDIFNSIGAGNVKWVFSVNSENVPKENNYMDCYPGDEHVDFIGIDGYNWGSTQSWSRWMSFKEIFDQRYEEAVKNFRKPVVISEFSSTTSGGDKAKWIRDAMSDIKKMKDIKAFVLFNADKETDWSFPADKAQGIELRTQLKDKYFKK